MRFSRFRWRPVAAGGLSLPNVSDHDRSLPKSCERCDAMTKDVGDGRKSIVDIDERPMWLKTDDVYRCSKVDEMSRKPHLSSNGHRASQMTENARMPRAG